MYSLKVSWSSKFTPRFRKSLSHAVKLEWQGRQEAQSLPGLAVGDVTVY